MVLGEAKALIETLRAILSSRKQAKRDEQRRALFKLLSGMKPNEMISVGGVYRIFEGQVEKPLFADETEVESVLRSMGEDGVQFNMSSKCWSIGTDNRRFRPRF